MTRLRFMAVSLCMIVLCLTACVTVDANVQPSQEQPQESIAPSASSTEAAAAPASPEEMIYFSPDNSFSVMVPQDWDMDNSSNPDQTTVLFTPPIQIEGNLPSATFSVTYYDTLEDAEFSEWFKDLIYESLSNIEMISEETDESNGIERYRYELTGVFDPSGAPMHCIYCYLVKDTSIYFEAYAAETEMWDEYSPIFEKMSESFVALSSPDISPVDFPEDTQSSFSGVETAQNGVTENRYGNITAAYSENGTNHIEIDYVDVLSGDAAVQKALKDGAEKDENGNLIWTDGVVVNTEWYVVNMNEKLRTFELSDSCSIQIFGASQMLEVNFNDFQERLLDFGYDDESDAQTYMFAWIDIQNGLVVSIVEAND